MSESWNILVVDDEADIHSVSQLALRHRKWKGKGFELAKAMSGAEARAILSNANTPLFHVALIDVVMESNDAGLKVCEFIRENMSPSLRIILRTGQPGMWPEDDVMERYDIDQYLAKGEVQAARLFAAVRTACRMSVDMASTSALEHQLQGLTEALSLSSTEYDHLLNVMCHSLDFLERKHDVGLVFASRLDGKQSDEVALGKRLRDAQLDLGSICRALCNAGQSGQSGLLDGAQYGLQPASAAFINQPLMSISGSPPSGGWGRKILSILGVAPPLAAPPTPVSNGYYVDMSARELSPKELKDLARDLALFSGNWRLAFTLFSLRETTIRERVTALDAKRQAVIGG